MDVGFIAVRPATGPRGGRGVQQGGAYRGMQQGGAPARRGVQVDGTCRADAACTRDSSCRGEGMSAACVRVFVVAVFLWSLQVLRSCCTHGNQTNGAAWFHKLRDAEAAPFMILGFVDGGP